MNDTTINVTENVNETGNETITETYIKIILDKNILERVIKVLSLFSIVENNLLNTSYSCILVKYSSNNLTFATSNGSELCRITAIPFTFVSSTVEEFSTLVEIKALLSFVSSLSSADKITFEFLSDRLELSYKESKKNRFVIDYYDVTKAFLVDDTFESVKSVEANSLLVLDTATLKLIEDIILPCCATDSARAFLNGCYIDNDSIMATNSRLLGYLDLNKRHTNIKKFITQPFFLTQKFLQQLGDIGEQVNLTIYDYNIINTSFLDIQDQKIKSEVLGGIKSTNQFPDGYKILENVLNYPYCVSVNTIEFSESLKILHPFVDSFMRSSIQISIDNDYLYLKTTGKSKLGEDYISITSKNTNLPSVFSFVISLEDLKGVLYKFNSSTVSIYFSDNPLLPIGIESKDEGVMLIIATLSIVTDNSNNKGDN